MIPIIKCSNCKKIYEDTQHNIRSLRYHKIPKSIQKVYDECPICQTGEYLEDILSEEILTANSKKEVEELADKHYPDYLYLKTTTRGTGRHWKLHNYIYVK